MVKKRVSKEIIQKVKLFAQKAEESGLRMESLILFGSQVHGRVKPYSDIDVCIVASQFGKDEIDLVAELRLLADSIDWRIEPHLFKPEDLKIREDPFVHEILSTGVKIL